MYRIKKSYLAAFCALLFCITLTPVQATKSDESKAVVFTSPDTASVEISSSRHTQLDSTAVIKNRMNTAGYEKKLENGSLEVWFRASTASIRIVDKSSGYIWGELTQDKGKDLNEKWSAFANSLCSIDYYDENNLESRISLSDESMEVAYEWSGNQLHCRFTATTLNISLAFTMTLEQDSLLFKVDTGSLKESGENHLKSLYFVPFLGSTYADEINGYMFIPDGCGALIRYSKSSQYLSGYDKRIYGLDVGIDQMSEEDDLQANRTNDYMVDTQNVTLPVYGVVHGARQNALFTVIESGMEYTSIVSSAAGISTDYNWVTARFDYRQMYTSAIGDGGTLVSQPQAKTNSINPAMRIYFLSGNDADYSGMANLYREKLKAQGVLKTEKIDSNIPLRLEVIASEVKKGFLFNSVRTLTTTNQASDFADELHTLGIDNVTMVMRGWQKGGLSGATYGSFNTEGKIGGMQGLVSLRDKILKLGGSFYLYTNPVTANKDQISLSSNAAVTLGHGFAQLVSANTEKMYSTEYFLQIRRIKDFLSSAYKELDGFSLSADNLGSELYGDYSKNNEYTRSQSLQEIATLLKNSGTTSMALYSPNLYCWKYTNAYFDIPVDNSQYLFETDTVPFLQMVLKGSIDYYAPYSNQGFYSKDSVLKMIEYAAYPSFITMAADNYELNNTPLTDYFSLNFEDWKGTIGSVYKAVDSVLSKVEGQEMVGHRVIEEGVVKVSYSGGTTVYVNYNSAAKSVDGITVPAVGYSVQK